MFQVVLEGDDFYQDSGYVIIGNVAKAIARLLLSNGARDRLKAERDAWPLIHTGVVSGKLHPLEPETLSQLSENNYGNGIVLFTELVEWGKWAKRFDFAMAAKESTQAPDYPDGENSGNLCHLPSALILKDDTGRGQTMKPQDEYVSALLLLAPYWDKPACELPENLREIASLLWDMATPEGRQNLARQHDWQYDPALQWLWYDCSMDARTWWGLQDIAPREAAMLLCRLNPLECEREDPERIYVDDDKLSPKRYRLLLLTFEDVAKVTPQARTLSQWLGIARDKQLQYHPWIDEYERGIGLVMLAEAPATPGTPEKGETAAMEKAPPAVDVDSSAAKVKDCLTKGQIIAAFQGLHYNAEQWSKYLASPPPWLVECRKAKGSKIASALWNPVEIAVALTDPKRGISVPKLDAVFVAHVFLAPWAEEWRKASDYLR
ncbi:MAG: hypothetical protein WC091_17515 [Sulfuricellaceae bacterium]